MLLFCRHLCEKRQIWVSEPILGKLWVTYDLGWWLVGKLMVDFLFALIELCSLSIMVPELWGEMCTARLFSQKGSPLLHSTFTWTGSSPVNHSWCQKPRNTGLPGGKDRILLHSLVSTQYRRVPDGRTDRQTDMMPVAYESACKAMVCGAL